MTTCALAALCALCLHAVAPRKLRAERAPAPANVTQAPAEQGSTKPLPRNECFVCPRPGFAFEVGIPVLLPFFSGTINGERGDDDESSEVVQWDSQLAFAGFAAMSFAVGDVTLGGDFLGAGLGNHLVLAGERGERPIGSVNVNGYVVHGWASYQVRPRRIGRGRVLLAARPMIAVRDVHIPLGVSTESENIDLAGTLHWTDPVVGARVFFDFQNGWLIDTALDVGGFTVGTTAALWGELRGQYNFRRYVGVWLGYTVYQAWFSPQRDFLKKATLLMQGPGLGITFYVP